MSRTGHCSTAGSSYKRASSTMAKAVSDVLQPPSGEPECKVKKVKSEKVDTSTESSHSSSLVTKHGDNSVLFNFMNSFVMNSILLF